VVLSFWVVLNHNTPYESHLSSLENSRLRGNLSALYRLLRSESGQGGAELFSLVSSDRMHGKNGSKLPQGRLKLDIRKHFFTETVVKHWNSILRGAADAPSLPVLKKHLDDACSTVL